MALSIPGGLTSGPRRDAASALRQFGRCTAGVGPREGGRYGVASTIGSFADRCLASA